MNSGKSSLKMLSIIVPAYNEAKTICPLLRRILAVEFPVEYEICVVDDCSQDGTDQEIEFFIEESQDPRIRLLKNSKNEGKGASVLKGFASAKGDILVVQDADFEYSPSDLPALLKPILEGKSEVVYGSRFLGRSYPEGMALPNYLANVFLTHLTNVLFGSRLTDMETCYKLLRQDILSSLQLNAKRFDFEPEITAKLIRCGKNILELPIKYEGRTAGEGKKIKARDFFIAIQVLFWNRFQK